MHQVTLSILMASQDKKKGGQTYKYTQTNKKKLRKKLEPLLINGLLTYMKEYGSFDKFLPLEAATIERVRNNSQIEHC